VAQILNHFVMSSIESNPLLSWKPLISFIDLSSTQKNVKNSPVIAVPSSSPSSQVTFISETSIF
jgi:hypothetical protein